MTAPLSMRQVPEGMALGFDPPAGSAPSAVLELAFTGDDGGTYHLVMSGGSCRFEPRPVEVATLPVETDAQASSRWPPSGRRLWCTPGIH